MNKEYEVVDDVLKDIQRMIEVAVDKCVERRVSDGANTTLLLNNAVKQMIDERIWTFFEGVLSTPAERHTIPGSNTIIDMRPMRDALYRLIVDKVRIELARRDR